MSAPLRFRSQHGLLFERNRKRKIENVPGEFEEVIMQDLDILIQKILNDPAFLKELAVAPEAALRLANITVSEDVLKTLKGKDEAGLREFAAKYAKGKAAS
jgi:hypothetical protein